MFYTMFLCLRFSSEFLKQNKRVCSFYILTDCLFRVIIDNVSAQEIRFAVTLQSMPGFFWRGTVVERRSLAGELSLSCARPAADG